MSLAAAVMPMSVVGTVVLRPLMAPFVIPGLTVSGWAIGKPLLLTVMLPLVIGVAIKFAPNRWRPRRREHASAFGAANRATDAPFPRLRGRWFGRRDVARNDTGS